MGRDQRDQSPEWPVLRRYEAGNRRAISVPLGGIGTGTIGLGGRGQTRDWELQNHPDKGSLAPGTFFAVRAAGGGQLPTARILEGALFDEEYEGDLGSPVALAGIPRFSRCTFEAAYPLCQVQLEDDHFPLTARVRAFNPLVPGDAEASGLPVICWAIRVHNTSSEALDVSVMLSVANFIGARLRAGGRDCSRPTFRTRHGAGLMGVVLGEDGLDGDDEEWGRFAAAVVGGDHSWVGPVWSHGKWNQGILAMWRGFVDEGIPGTLGGEDSSAGSVNADVGTPAATMGTHLSVPALGHAEATFAFGWNFPNRRSWVFTGPGPTGGPGAETIGNAYASPEVDPWQTLEVTVPGMADLERRTVDFVAAVVGSDLPEVVREAALFNLSTLRSPTVFRSADGMPWGWEGVLDHAGSCPGSCTHVWNYEFATPFLFGDLARRMRENEFLRATGEDGAMAFRIGLPDEGEQRWTLAAADGQFGCIIKLYREWQLCGDGEFLRRLWPYAKKAIAFAWLEGSWDGDRDGVAEGALHNTLDIEYYGPTSVIQGWYLGALRAAAQMASWIGDVEFAATCQDLERRGAAWTEAHLFNGSYYQQEIRPPRSFEAVHRSTRHRDMGAEDAGDPEFQMGSGCLVDQLAGVVSAEIVGLGKVFDRQHVVRSLAAVHRFNYVPRFADWTNYMRSYVLGEDRGHIIMAYPDGVPDRPMPYWCEVMTGYEYMYALALAQAHLWDQAEDVVRSIRDRYDGRRRNPFDEAECGHHYARAMAAWGLVNVWTGFHYSAVDRTISFAAGGAGSRWFWSTGWAWGLVHQHAARGREVTIEVREGSLSLRYVTVGAERLDLGEERVVAAGEVIRLGVGMHGGDGPGE